MVHIALPVNGETNNMYLSIHIAHNDTDLDMQPWKIKFLVAFRD